MNTSRDPNKNLSTLAEWGDYYQESEKKEKKKENGLF